MTATTDLHLYEQILLLMLDDDKGTFDKRHHVTMAVAAAADAELLVRGLIAVTHDGSKTGVKAVDAGPTGDAVLDACLAVISEASKPPTLVKAIKRQAKLPDLRHLAAAPLVRRGIVRHDDHAVLGLIHTTRYPEVDHATEAGIVARVEAAVFSDTDLVDTDTRLLVALCVGTGLLDAMFGHRRVKQRAARIEALTDEAAVGAALKRAVDDLTASLAVVMATSTDQYS